MVCGQAAYRDSEATQVWTESVMPNTGPGLRKSLLDGVNFCDVRTEGGLYVGKTSVFTFDAHRIRRVVERIAAGLLWHLYHARVSDRCTMYTHYQPAIEPIKEILLSSTYGQIGNTAFRYRHAVACDAPESSFWGMQFFEGAHFVVIIQGPRPESSAEIQADL